MEKGKSVITKRPWTRWQMLWALLVFGAPFAQAGIGSPHPVNPCPAAARFCQAGGAEAGVPHDFPSRQFLSMARGKCMRSSGRLMALGRLPHLPGLNMLRMCTDLTGFLGATPGEWRALGVAAMSGNSAASLRVKHQLLRQMLAALGVAHPSALLARMPAGLVTGSRSLAMLQGSAGPALPQRSGAVGAPVFRKRREVRAVDRVIARRIRTIRVAQERTARRRYGHAVRLPVGSCQAVVRLSAQGVSNAMTHVQCSSHALRRVLREAVFGSEPLIVETSGHPERVRIDIFAPIAEPGPR